MPLLPDYSQRLLGYVSVNWGICPVAVVRHNDVAAFIQFKTIYSHVRPASDNVLTMDIMQIQTSTVIHFNLLAKLAEIRPHLELPVAFLDKNRIRFVTMEIESLKTVGSIFRHKRNHNVLYHVIDGVHLRTFAPVHCLEVWIYPMHYIQSLFSGMVTS